VKEQGRSEGADSSQTKTEPKEQGRTKNPSEAGKDYRDALSSIRADQDLETFVADLRQNKEQLLSFAKDFMKMPGDTLQERGAYLTVGIYMEYVLKEHVFGMDPFASNRPDFSEELEEHIRAQKEENVGYLAKKLATRWRRIHPPSLAAKEISHLSIFALPDSHKKLLQEMWPAIRTVALPPPNKT
jgi:hypothetical protein